MSTARIKQAALKLFALKGYEGTTMREIGEEAGMKAASIYNHFESKESLFLLLVRETLSKMDWELTEDKLTKDYELPELKELLFDIFIGYYTFFSAHQTELKFWQRIRYFSPPELEGAYDVNRLGSGRPLLHLYRELFHSTVGKNKGLPFPVEMYIMFYFSFISGYIDSLLIMPFPLSKVHLEQAFEIFWSGLAG
ncbi:TetR/AcrR family transcriptional regulator [Paenibacillus pinistramenti]|uniref:TetR/AcrR family transcriptional regulator n=1 Tax=Paenibacillus pinistramenti TaxID=1768003 RepID=UPI0013967EBC|nr:TetR/AcrR family transcriptional regulator [Paenibacillus pinistramenti]